MLVFAPKCKIPWVYFGSRVVRRSMTMLIPSLMRMQITLFCVRHFHICHSMWARWPKPLGFECKKLFNVWLWSRTSSYNHKFYRLNWAKKGIVHVHTLVLLIKNIGCSCGYLVLNMMRKLVKFGSGSINSYGRHRIAKLIKWGLKIICFRYDSWYFPQHRKPDYIVQTGLGKYFFIYWK